MISDILIGTIQVRMTVSPRGLFACLVSCLPVTGLNLDMRCPSFRVQGSLIEHAGLLDRGCTRRLYRHVSIPDHPWQSSPSSQALISEIAPYNKEISTHPLRLKIYTGLVAIVEGMMYPTIAMTRSGGGGKLSAKVGKIGDW